MVVCYTACMRKSTTIHLGDAECATVAVSTARYDLASASDTIRVALRGPAGARRVDIRTRGQQP